MYYASTIFLTLAPIRKQFELVVYWLMSAARPSSRSFILISLSHLFGLSSHTEQMERIDPFSENRRHLFAVAYRMTGSVADAEDLVQETYLRWQNTRCEEIREPRAFLTTVLTRMALKHMESARVRREEYVGQWLPEPLVTAESRDSAELSESLQIAFLVLLESLSPQERAIFLLAEVFDYSHAEIAAILDKSEEACRQMLRRAKQALSQKRRRYQADREKAEDLTGRFFKAVQTGQTNELVALLHDDVVAYSDGGGRTQAALNPIYGSDRVARFMIGIAQRGGTGLSRFSTLLHDQPGTIGFRDGIAQTALILDVEEDRIRNLYIIVNPDKLKRIPKEESIHAGHPLPTAP